MIFKKCLLIGALIAPLFSQAADHDKKSDAEPSYQEQLAQYNKLKQSAQDFMDKIMHMREKTYIMMSQFSKKAELSDVDINQWNAMNDKFKALRDERDKLFGPPPIVQFYSCATLAGIADLAWDAQYHYFTKVISGRYPSPEDFIQVVNLDTDVAKMAAECQQGIETPPEKPDPDSVIIDVDPPASTH